LIDVFSERSNQSARIIENGVEINNAISVKTIGRRDFISTNVEIKNKPIEIRESGLLLEMNGSLMKKVFIKKLNYGIR